MKEQEIKSMSDEEFAAYCMGRARADMETLTPEELTAEREAFGRVCRGEL